MNDKKWSHDVILFVLYQATMQYISRWVPWPWHLVWFCVVKYYIPFCFTKYHFIIQSCCYRNKGNYCPFWPWNKQWMPSGRFPLSWRTYWHQYFYQPVTHSQIMCWQLTAHSVNDQNQTCSHEFQESQNWEADFRNMHSWCPLWAMWLYIVALSRQFLLAIHVFVAMLLFSWFCT